MRVGAFGPCLAGARVRLARPQSSWRESALRASADVPSTAETTLGALRPAVRLLAAAGTSFYGDWLSTVALVVLLFRATNSPVGPALYMVARVAPRVLGPFPGGALADRFGPARVAAMCAVVQGILTAGIVVLADLRWIWPIFIVVALAQFLSSAAQPCYGALIPRVTTPSGLGRIQGIYSGLNSSSLLVSPALGALLLPFVAPQALIGVDALTFFVAAGLLTTLLRVGGESADGACVGSHLGGDPDRDARPDASIPRCRVRDQRRHCDHASGSTRRRRRGSVRARYGRWLAVCLGWCRRLARHPAGDMAHAGKGCRQVNLSQAPPSSSPRSQRSPLSRSCRSPWSSCSSAGWGPPSIRPEARSGLQQRTPRQLLGRTTAVDPIRWVPRHAARGDRRVVSGQRDRVGSHRPDRLRGRCDAPLRHRRQ